jgi:hypothetical protein
MTSEIKENGASKPDATLSDSASKADKNAGKAYSAGETVPSQPLSPHDELVRLLQEATTIEHAIMVQYLYAAFSIKSKYEKLRGDRCSISDSSNLLGIAIQEMRHLHIGNLMLIALGAKPNLRPPGFPFKTNKIYPFDLVLSGLSAESMSQYLFVEASSKAIDRKEPKPEDKIFITRLYDKLGDDCRPNQLGSLYGKIITISEEIIDAKLASFEIAPEKMREWIDELKKIKTDGEDAHFAFLRKVFMGEHKSLPDKSPSNIWDDKNNEDYPSYPVPENPSARIGHPNQIDNTMLLKVARLGNLHYWIILDLLNLSYERDDWKIPNNTQPQHYMELAKLHMRGPLVLLGMYLAEQNAGMPFDVPPEDYYAETDLQVRISRVIFEAEELAREITRHSLPNGFKPNIYSITHGRLNHKPKE